VLNSQRTYLTTFDVSSGVFAARIAFPATAGPFRKWDGALSVYQTPTPTPLATPVPRDVPPQAVAFHNLAPHVGLPAPFDRLPYNIIQTGQEDDNDPLSIVENRNGSSQGFGPSTFSYEDYYYTDGQGNPSINSLYDGTFQIHPGLDYGNGRQEWQQRVIVSICDGVIIQGRGQASNGRDNGGSAQPGRGVSVRCFMDSPSSGRADTDGDGVPNLSNIIVVYSHLLWTAEDPFSIRPRGPYLISCQFLEVGCTGNYTLPMFRYPGSQDVVPADAIRTGDVVRAGDVLGQTGADEVDHLHLEIWLAQGYLKSVQAGVQQPDHALSINPLLMFASPVVDQHLIQDYFPVTRSLERPVIDGLGISIGELDLWSLGGLNQYLGSGSGFYSAQNPQQTGVEWPFGLYPRPLIEPLSINDLIGFLETRYGADSRFVPINCPVTIETVLNRVPEQREIASCPMPDLLDHALVP
jgi:hypothetical protein